MTSRTLYTFRLPLLIAAVVALFLSGGSAYANGGCELKARVEAATKNLADLSFVVKVVDSDKKAISKIEPNYARLYEFKSAGVMLKLPDKMRMEGKLGMVRFEYIVNGTTKIFRASPIRINKRDDYSDDPAKLQTALDVGLVTGSMWENRSVRIVDDAEAKERGEIKLELRWLKGDMVYSAWIDEKDLWLKKFEKRDGEGNLKVQIVYSDPKNIAESVWLPTKTEVFAPDGDRAASTEISDIKYNSGLLDSLFE